MKPQNISRNIKISNEADGDVIDIFCYGYIGEDWWTGDGFTKEKVLNEIKGKTFKTGNLHISSLGGDIDHALAIKDLIIDTKAPFTAHVSGLTASSATIVMMSCGKINMSADASLLIHNTSTVAWGTKKDLRKAADELDRFDNIISGLYERKSGKKWEDVSAKMDEDTWMNATEAKTFGIIDEVITKIPVTAIAKSAIQNAITTGKIKLPTGFNIESFQIENSNSDDMSKNKSAMDIMTDFFQNLKAAGMKIISDEAKENPAEAEKKINDITDKFVKAVEDYKAEEPETVTNAVADYTATVTESVTSVELVDDTNLELPGFPYEVSEEGATALAEDLASAVTAESVSVAYSADDANLTITVKGTETELKSVNGSVNFTKTEQEEGSDDVENLKKKVAANQKKIEAAKKQAPKNTDTEELKNLKDKIAAQELELSNIKQGKSGGKSNGKTPGGNSSKDEKKNEGEAFVSGMASNYLKNR